MPLSLGLGKVTNQHYNKLGSQKTRYVKRLLQWRPLEAVSDANRTKKQFNSVEIISVSYAMGGIYL